MYCRLTMVVALTLAVASLSAGAAGFDCDRATRAAERAICENADLSAMDSHQVGLYAGLLEVLPPDTGARLRATQRAFLAERNGCNANVPCLQSAYLFRFHELCGISKLYGRSCADNGEQPH